MNQQNWHSFIPEPDLEGDESLFIGRERSSMLSLLSEKIAGMVTDDIDLCRRLTSSAALGNIRTAGRYAEYLMNLEPATDGKIPDRVAARNKMQTIRNILRDTTLLEVTNNYLETMNKTQLPVFSQHIYEELWQCVNKWKDGFKWRFVSENIVDLRIAVKNIVLESDGLRKEFGDWVIDLRIGRSIVEHAIYRGDPEKQLTSPGEGYTHPHVENERICYGGAVPAIIEAREEFNLFEIFNISETCLRSYFRGGSYVRLEYFKTYQQHIEDGVGVCAACGDSDEEIYLCECCGTTVCYGCSFHCGDCGNTYCEDCSFMKAGGDGYVCESCIQEGAYAECFHCSGFTLNACPECGKGCCEEHLDECVACEKMTCPDCTDEAGLCPSCARHVGPCENCGELAGPPLNNGLSTCTECGKIACDKCCYICKDCGEVFCKECMMARAPEDGRGVEHYCADCFPESQEVKNDT